MDEPEVKIVDVFICKLRRKLTAATGEHYIETFWAAAMFCAILKSANRQPSNCLTLRSRRDHERLRCQSPPWAADHTIGHRPEIINHRHEYFNSVIERSACGHSEISSC